MALLGSDQVIDEFPGRKIYVGKKDGNKLENITVFEMNEQSLPVRVTFARTGMLEADLPNKRILMRLCDARYQQRDEKNPLDLRKIRDGISMAEGTLPISLDELYEKEKKRPSRSALSITQLVDQLKSANKRERSASRTELNKRFSFPFSCAAFSRSYDLADTGGRGSRRYPPRLDRLARAFRSFHFRSGQCGKRACIPESEALRRDCE